MADTITGRTALITGAASGIGRALAIELARRGCDLALCDIDEAGLAGTAAVCGGGRSISLHRLDVADADAVAALPEVVRRAHPRLDILVNNAGVALGGTFEQVSDADMHWLFDINFWGVVRMTRAFLPMMRAGEGGRIVNVSSLFGFIAPPGQAAYAASKFAVRAFSESLRHELADTGVSVSTVHPGGVATAIADNARLPGSVDEAEVAAERARFARLLRLTPERAATAIADGLARRRPRIVVGRDAKLMAMLERLMPTGYWRLLSKLQ